MNPRRCSAKFLPEFLTPLWQAETANLINQMRGIHGGSWRDKTYHHLQICEARYVRHAPGDVLAKAWCICPTSQLVRKNQSAFAGEVDQRRPLQYRNGI